MENKKKLKDVLSSLGDSLDILNYERKHNFSDYSEVDYELLKLCILELSEGFVLLSNIINHD